MRALVLRRGESAHTVGMKQVGGRLLGQGVYGCTFDPAPRCAGGSVFRSVGDLPAVGKVTSEDAGDELAIGKAIMKLPLAANYFALPSIGCRPEIPTGDNDERSCRVITEAGKGTTFSMLIMPAAGSQLLKWSMDLPHLAEGYLNTFVHLLEGMLIYQRAGYVHNDIHMGNVLVDERGVARYIDFGLAFRVADVRAWEDSNLGTRFRPKYVWQAPEVHAWRMRLNGVRAADGAAQLQTNSDEYRKIEHQYSRAPLANTLTAFLAATPRDEVAFLRQYATGFDCWRIGLMFWMLWDDLLKWSGLQGTALWERRDLVRSILNGLTQFDPRQRWSAEKALAALDPSNRLLTS